MVDGSFKTLTSSPSKNAHNAQRQYLMKDNNEKEMHPVRLYAEKGINYDIATDVRIKLLLTVTVYWLRSQQWKLLKFVGNFASCSERWLHAYVYL